MAGNSKNKAYKLIIKKEKALIASLHAKTQIDTWSLAKCVDELKRECKNNNYEINEADENAQQLLEENIENHIDDFIKKGRTRIYM